MGANSGMYYFGQSGNGGAELSMTPLKDVNTLNRNVWRLEHSNTILTLTVENKTISKTANLIATTSWVICALNGNTNAFSSKVKIYAYKITDINNNVLINLIPVLDPQGIPCMYDKVSKTYFYNQGTGEFLYKIK